MCLKCIPKTQVYGFSHPRTRTSHTFPSLLSLLLWYNNSTGAPVRPPEPSVPNPDYVQCPYCKRRFQEYAAERHIPFCKEQNDRIERKVSGSGNSALTKRLKYKPPLPRKRTGTEGTIVHNPPGSSIPLRKTNFSSTYTVDESNDGYQTTGL